MAIKTMTSYVGTTATYDDTTGILSMTLPSGLTEEQATLKVLENLESSAQGKRTTDLNFPTCEKSFPDNPNVSIVNRSNGTTSENQIERLFQIVGMYKLTAPTYVNAVNNDD